MFSFRLFCSSLACVLAAQSALTETCHGHAKPPTWLHKNQEAWPEQNCRAGKSQSPVNIRWPKDVEVDWDRKVIKSPLKFENYGKFEAVVENDAHTVHVSSVNNVSTFGLLSGGPLGDRVYKFSNFHFHWQSEHVFDGYRYPLELHLVHYRADLTPEAALNETDGYAVLAIFFTESFFGHSALDNLFKSVQGIRKPLTSVCQRFDLETLLPYLRDSYYTYKGSLTHPNCNEVVTWILLARPHGVTREQLNNFSKVDVGSQFNYRQLQPLNGRTIYSSRPFANIW